MTIKYFNRCS